MFIMNKVNQNLTIWQEAFKYYDAGFSIIPCKKTKSPAIDAWKKYQEGRMQHSQIKTNFKDAVAIGIIAGNVSNGLFFIDFDNKLQRAADTLASFTESLQYKGILQEQESLVVSTQSGGYHLYFKVIEGDMPRNAKLATEYDDDGTGYAAIETRGEGGYVLAPPSPGYELIKGSMDKVPEVTRLQLDYILDHAKTFSEILPVTEGLEVDNEDDDDELSDRTDKLELARQARRKNSFKKLVNQQFSWYAFRLLLENGWQITPGGDSTALTRPGKNPKEGSSATFGYKTGNTLKLFTANDAVFKENRTYTPFEVVSKLQFQGNEKVCLSWFKKNHDLHPNAKDYIRVGNDWFEIYHQRDQFGILNEKFDSRLQGIISLDHGSPILKAIPKFKSFVVVPDNMNHQDVIDEHFFNLYRPLPHAVKRGSWEKTKSFLQHVFQEHFDLGMDYLQLLYMKPKQRLPSLVLVSEEQQTGKTTFVEWLDRLFSRNAQVVDASLFDNKFTVDFAPKNIIICDEAIVRNPVTFEKLKRLATQSTIIVDEKYCKTFEVDFFGKLVISGNRESDIVRMAMNETRYWVHKLPLPIKSEVGLAKKLVAEMPAFLYHLQHRKMIVKEEESRLYFNPERTQTAQGDIIKRNSQPTLAKEIIEHATDMFHKYPENHEHEIHATLKDIKRTWFKDSFKLDLNYLRKVLKEDLKMEPVPKARYYQPMVYTANTIEGRDQLIVPSGTTGRFFIFKREDFVKDDEIDTDEYPPELEPEIE